MLDSFETEVLAGEVGTELLALLLSGFAAIGPLWFRLCTVEDAQVLVLADGTQIVFESFSECQSAGDGIVFALLLMLANSRLHLLRDAGKDVVLIEQGEGPVDDQVADGGVDSHVWLGRRLCPRQGAKRQKNGCDKSLHHVPPRASESYRELKGTVAEPHAVTARVRRTQPRLVVGPLVRRTLSRYPIRSSKCLTT